MHKVSAILLAAGLSNRMQGPNKLLMHLDGTPIISQTYAALVSSEINHVVVVTGRDADTLKEVITLRDNDQFVHNEAFETGMTSSIQTGLKQILDSQAVIICLGDMPLLTSEDYDLLINTFEKMAGADKILVPWYNETRANPVIFGSDFFGEISQHKAANGCVGVIKNHPEKVLNLKVASERFIRDLDTPEDFKKLKA